MYHSITNYFFLILIIYQIKFIRLNQEVKFEVSPSEPVYYYYNFKQNASIVLLHVTSNDDTCMTLSIQNSSV